MSLPPVVSETWALWALGPDDTGPFVVFDLGRNATLMLGTGTPKGAFRDACNKPQLGKARRPRQLQVASATLLAALRDAMPGVTVSVAELPASARDAVAAAQARERTQSGDLTHLPAALEADLMELAVELLDLAPWDVLDDTDAITLRAPAFGIDAGDLIVMGGARKQLGLLVFRDHASRAEFERSVNLAPGTLERLSDKHHVLMLDPASEVPVGIRQAAWRHRVDAPHLPFPVTLSATMRLTIASEEETRLLVAVGRALLELFDRFEGRLVKRHATTVERAGVTLTFNGTHAFAPDDDVATASPSPWGEREVGLLEELVALADGELGPAWRADLDPLPERPVRGLVVWPALVAGKYETTTVIAALRARVPGAFESPSVDALVKAQVVAWTGLWEVTELHPGSGFLARDLLTHEVRTVRDVSASRTLAPLSVICARVVTIGNESWLAGAATHALTPAQADAVRRDACEQFRWPKTQAVALAKVLEARPQRELARLWAESVEAASNAPLVMKSASGERLEDVTDRLRIVKSVDFTRVGAATPSGATTWTLRLADAATALSDLVVRGEELVATSPSVAQADRLRAHLSATFGASLTPVAREIRDLGELVRARARERGNEPRLSAVPAPEVQAAILQHKAQHYATWPDIPVPALDDQTPRAAARTKRGRPKVERLLVDMEHMEQRSPPGTRFDFDTLRRELGLLD